MSSDDRESGAKTPAYAPRIEAAPPGRTRDCVGFWVALNVR
jgi:hypothetical protein